MYQYIPFFDLILDSSEYYDYDIGENVIDYIIYQRKLIETFYLLAENGFILTTEDNKKLRFD